MTSSVTPIEVLLEVGSKRCFARALDWPGLARAAKDPHLALDALADAVPRYRSVLTAARISHGPLRATPALSVTERQPGTAGTEFGAPVAIAAADRALLTGATLRRWVDILEATWAALDAAASGAPDVLPKGPRGGGRDRDEILVHIAEAERSYASRIGIRMPVIRGDLAVHRTGRAELAAVLRDPTRHPPLMKWPLRYAIHRIAWHVLDHAWELEDKSN
jgi:hypothetical protein